MNASDYLADPEFLALCAIWKEKSRCPLVFGDWLRDRELWEQGKRSDWAVSEPDRPLFEEPRNKIGPTPKLASGGDWHWYPTPKVIDADDLPGTIYSPEGELLNKARTFPEAIAVFLDNFTCP